MCVQIAILAQECIAPSLDLPAAPRARYLGRSAALPPPVGASLAVVRCFGYPSRCGACVVPGPGPGPADAPLAVVVSPGGETLNPKPYTLNRCRGPCLVRIALRRLFIGRAPRAICRQCSAAHPSSHMLTRTWREAPVKLRISARQERLRYSTRFSASGRSMCDTVDANEKAHNYSDARLMRVPRSGTRCFRRRNATAARPCAVALGRLDAADLVRARSALVAAMSALPQLQLHILHVWMGRRPRAPQCRVSGRGIRGSWGWSPWYGARVRGALGVPWGVCDACCTAVSGASCGRTRERFDGPA